MNSQLFKDDSSYDYSEEIEDSFTDYPSLNDYSLQEASTNIQTIFLSAEGTLLSMTTSIANSLYYYLFTNLSIPCSFRLDSIHCCLESGKVVVFDQVKKEVDTTIMVEEVSELVFSCMFVLL